MCIHCETIICSRIICECLLYISCVLTVIQLYVAELVECLLYFSCEFTVIQLHVAEFYVSVYYTLHMSSL